ncbi:uncharacterized protein METZ01_LOCUS3567, partial [marine metagenome]|tara:strand:+ start:740 stop:949 length:210 start_codon:yes stop_codon:yes gene_type:complete
VKNLGIVALISGWLLLTAFGIYRGILESESLVFTISILVLWIGILILLVSAIRQRYKEAKDDPYKDVEI